MKKSRTVFLSTFFHFLFNFLKSSTFTIPGNGAEFFSQQKSVKILLLDFFSPSARTFLAVGERGLGRGGLGGRDLGQRPVVVVLSRVRLQVRDVVPGGAAAVEASVDRSHEPGVLVVLDVSAPKSSDPVRNLFLNYFLTIPGTYTMSAHTRWCG